MSSTLSIPLYLVVNLVMYLALNVSVSVSVLFAVQRAHLQVLHPSDGMCDQKGSFVDDEKLRFDFSWSGALSPEQVRK